jgi:hypothetical protein
MRAAILSVTLVLVRSAFQERRAIPWAGSRPTA